MPPNPLLDFSDLPPFDRIRPDHVAPAIDALLADAEKALAAVTAPEFPADWRAISKVLDVATEGLSRAWSVVGHLNAVADTPELRAAYNAAIPRVTAFWARLGCDERLYARYKAIDVATLDAEQRQAHKNTIRNFVLGGAELKGQARERFTAIEERLAGLCQKFSENVLDATDGFAYYAQREELEGIPADVIATARAAAQAEGHEGHKLTLKMPCYLPVMQFAHNGALRERLYRAYVTRASELGDPALDNTGLIGEILALRQEQAALLGYANFGELSLVPKMAKAPAQVMRFLRDLAAKARPYGERDLADLRAFGAEHLGIADPQAWDWSYISEKLKEARYAFSESELKQYFPAPKVLAGLFKTAETLFEITIRRDSAPVWHSDVEFYCIERETRKIGQFYLDPCARAAKRSGAWMDDVRGRWLRPDTGALQTPVAQLVCNFAQSVAGKPPLLTHDDVITLFHEFGHGLQHLLTQVNEHDVSGISGVEWDAVELSSQFMENFCWEWETLSHMTAHVDTGEPLPRALYDKMIAAKNFQSGLQTLRQIEFSLFDMRLHTEYDASRIDPSGRRVLALLDEVRAEVAVMPAPPFARMPNTFAHIFSGGYAAGYYSYKWAEVLSADAYAAFEETAGIETGRRFREAILETGGSRPAMESFVAFRGREPQLDALLRHQGMISTPNGPAPGHPAGIRV